MADDFVTKFLNAGIEMQNKALDVVDELVKKGKVDQGEFSEFVDSIKKNVDEYKVKGEGVADEVITNVTSHLPIVSKKDFDALKEEVVALQQAVADLQIKRVHHHKKECTAKKEHEIKK